MTQLSLRFTGLLVFLSACQHVHGNEGPDLLGDFAIGSQIVEAVGGDHSFTNLFWYPVDPENASGEPSQGYFDHSGGRFLYPRTLLGGFHDVPVSTAGPFPLVALSHGHEGNPGGYTMLAESLASHGYVVVAPQHKYERPPAAEMQFLLDSVTAKNENPDDAFFGAIDLAATAMGGYSHGGDVTVLAITGNDEVPADDRVRAILLLDSLVPNNEVIDLPTLAMAGGHARTTTVLDRLPSVQPFYGLDFSEVDNVSFRTSICQIGDQILAADPPQEFLDVLPDRSEWNLQSPCNPDFQHIQPTMSRQSVAFLDTVLKDDRSHEPFIRADSSEGSVLLEVLVDGNGRLASLLLTDPDGRQLGAGPLSEIVNDLGDQARFRRGRRATTFILPAEDLVPGEYVLTGTGDTQLLE
ncbi:MAG: hypothetical protein P8N76_08010 [Pirellulaceae bacterium]|nr:hypothetical protein [Pirellulaceae bacterium]